MQKHITIGVAGHVDHGKTSLVKALTGIDTDRLQEEKRRGLSIDSGVAIMDSVSGSSVALVDVPGHVDFLKNTIRGLSCVDAAILVVAADDGIMPQTTEHLEMLRFFGADTGVVVLTKADLVDEETLELAELEIREMLEGSHLEHAPVIPFSTIDHRGFDRIVEQIAHLAMTAPGKDPEGPFRFWIDRVKGFAGFGTVVSGTVLSGTLKENEPVQVLPSGMESRARSLECHHRKLGQLRAGQRGGINLHKVRVDDVQRGMLLAEPGVITPGFLLNVEIRLLQNALKPLKNRQRIKLCLGTSINNAMVVLMEKDVLLPGERGLAQLRVMRPLAGAPADPFVFSPLNHQSIIGGGKVLEVPKEKFRQAKASGLIPCLTALAGRNLSEYLTHRLKLGRDELIRADHLSRDTGFPAAEVQKEINARLRNGELLSFSNRGVFPASRFKALKNLTLGMVQTLLRENPLKRAVSFEEIRSKLAPFLDDSPFQRIIAELVGEKKLIKEEGGFNLPRRSAGLSEEQEALISMLLDYAGKSGLVPVGAGSFCKLHAGLYNKNEVQRLLDYLHAQGRLCRLNNRRFLTPQAVELIMRRVKTLIDKNGVLTVADCKEVLGYGRSVGISVFEYLDSVDFTVRDGDVRRLKQSREKHSATAFQ